MTDARFSSDTGAALILTGDGPQPASIELVGPARAGGGGDQRRWREVAGRRAAAGRALGRAGAASANRRLHAAVEPAAGAAPEPPAAVPLAQLGTVRASFDGRSVRIGPPIDPAYDSGEGAGSARAPLRDAARRGSRTRCSSRASTAGTRAAIRSPSTANSPDEPPASRAIGASSISPCAYPTAPSRWSKAAPSGGAPAALPVCSWSTTGCVVASSAARARSCCRRGTAHPSSDWRCIARASTPGVWPRSPGSPGAGTCFSPRTRTRRASSARRTRSSPGPSGSRAIPATTC